ncbi:anti-sigma factor family protein [Yinghuangia aomiensis]
MNHPEDKLAAYVDGELGHEAREKVLAHLAQCAECRAEAEEQRRVKALLATSARPEPSGDLMARLLALGAGDAAGGPGGGGEEAAPPRVAGGPPAPCAVPEPGPGFRPAARREFGPARRTADDGAETRQAPGQQAAAHVRRGRGVLDDGDGAGQCGDSG